MNTRAGRDLVDAALRRARLGEPWDPKGALADDAAWLALMALGERVRPALERLLAGDEERGAPRDEPSRLTGPPGRRLRRRRPAASHARSRLGRVDDGVTHERVALALLLRGQVADRETGAAERAAAALACIAIGCADADAGRVLQQGMAQLDLLDIVKQIPIAARVRTLALEFRFRALGALPAKFVARVQDLLERLDREGLLGVALHDRASPDERARELSLAATTGGDPRLRTVLQALHTAPGPLDAPGLEAACVALAPALWGEGPARRRAVLAAYRALAARLPGGVLPAKARRYGLST